MSGEHRLIYGACTSLLSAITIASTGGCSLDGPEQEAPGAITSEAEARKVVTYNVRSVFPGHTVIAPQHATLTPCTNFYENAIGLGPPWIVSATEYLPRPEQIAEAVRRVDTLVERGYRLQPRGPLPSYPEQRVYKDHRGYTIGVSASKLPDRVDFTVNSESPARSTSLDEVSRVATNA